MGFAESLKKIRHEKHLSQQELADKLRVAQSTVGMWEAGKRIPKLGELNRLARALQVTIMRLVDQEEKKVEVINDEIYVDGTKLSELGKGDVKEIIDHINLLRSRTSPSTELEKPPRNRPGAKKILIIDDEQEISEMLYSFLVPHNYKVFLAFNGQMGLEYFEEVKPDVVLLDLTLPDIDGIEVLTIIRKVSAVPVIIITGHPENVADIHLKDLTIEGFLEKPIVLQKILNTLKHIIGE